MKFTVTVSPDPFTADLLVMVHGAFTANIIVRLSNSRHTVIRTAACSLATGMNRIPMANLQRFAAGLYQLEISLLNGAVIETIRLVKN